MITKEISIQSLSELENFSTRARNVCEQNNIMTLGDLLKLTEDEVCALPNCGARTSAQLIATIRKFGYLNREGSGDGLFAGLMGEEGYGEGYSEPFIAADPDAVRARQILESMPPHLRKAFDTAYRNTFMELPGALTKQFESYSTLATAEDLLTCELNIRNKKPRRGHSGEFNKFLLSRRKDLLAVGDILAEDPEEEGQKKALVYCNSIAFPFLTEDECRLFSVMMMRKGNDIPAAYLLERCLRSSDSMAARTYCLRHGFNDKGEFLSYREIAERFSLSPERIRQYLSQPYNYPKSMEEVARKFDNSVKIDHIISSEDPVWSELIKQNYLVFNERKLMGLYTSVHPNLQLLQLEEGSPWYLVNRDLLKNVKVKIGFARLKNLSQLRREKPVKVSISSYYRSAPDAETHPEVFRINKIYTDYFRDRSTTDPSEPDMISMNATALNIPDQAAKLLEERNEPTHYTEIRRVLSERFPDMVNIKGYSLKQMLFLDPRFKPISRTGYYILSWWKQYFTGSIIEWMEKRIKEQGEPMTIKDLYEEARSNYPSTTMLSMDSLISYDGGKRVVSLGNGYVGLPGTDYSEFNLSRDAMSDSSYKAFEDNFSRYCNFVESHGHFPTLSNDRTDREASSLYLWRYNLRQGNRRFTDEQIERLSEFEKKNANLPLDGRELAFYNKASQYIEKLQTAGRISAKTDRQLYYWMRHVDHNFESLSQNCRRWAEAVRNAASRVENDEATDKETDYSGEAEKDSYSES